MEQCTQLIGHVSARVISLLGLPLEENQPIFLGCSNIAHMQSRHPADYNKYGAYIPMILKNPDYVGKNPKDDFIEYVKEFQIDGEYVKVAVRLSGGGKLYARSVYILNPNRVQNFIRKGTLKKV
ncbi:MAG: transposase [Ruminococcaceae bacterium]|nr:transposase [Oscillospiraceae bacterium]